MQIECIVTELRASGTTICDEDLVHVWPLPRCSGLEHRPASLTVMVMVGMALAWARGDSLFNLFTLPAFDPFNRALADQVQEVHATIGWIIVVVVGLHAAAALSHRLVWHDGVLGWMLPAGWARPVERSS